MFYYRVEIINVSKIQPESVEKYSSTLHSSFCSAKNKPTRVRYFEYSSELSDIIIRNVFRYRA